MATLNNPSLQGATGKIGDKASGTLGLLDTGLASRLSAGKGEGGRVTNQIGENGSVALDSDYKNER